MFCSAQTFEFSGLDSWCSSFYLTRTKGERALYLPLDLAISWIEIELKNWNIFRSIDKKHEWYKSVTGTLIKVKPDFKYFI